MTGITRVVLACFLILAGLPATAFPQIRRVAIGHLTFGPYYYEQECWERFKTELAVLGEGQFEFVYPPEFQVDCGWDPSRVAAAAAGILAEDGVDLVVGQGLAAAVFFFAQTALPKPVVLFGDLDLEFIEIPLADGRSPVANLTFQIQRDKAAADLFWLARLAEGKKKVSILIDPELPEYIPGLPERAAEAEKVHGLKFEFAFYGNTAAETVSALGAETEFLYLTPSARFNTLPKISELLEEINRRGIPTFALEGLPLVERGALAGLYAGSVEKVARANALKVYEILRGEPPESLEVYYRDKEDFTLNMATARRIGYYPAFDLLMEARQIGAEIEEGELFTPAGAVALALKNNLSYAVSLRGLEEQEKEYRKVLANLLPQLEGSAQYRLIDTDQAQASGGFLNRWETGLTLTAQQLLFDYPTWKAVSLAAIAVSLAEASADSARLDTAASALQAYLDVLQARELLRVRRENLEATRNHLGTARVRREQGMGGREDVLRWESQYKNALAQTISAAFSLRKAGLAFNQTLNRPQETPFRLAPPEGDEPWRDSILGAPELDRHFKNWRDADLLREFLVAEALKRSPEVLSASLSLSAAEADLSRARTRIWTPTLSGRFEYTRNLDEEVWDPISGSWGRAGEYPDDDEWFLGVSLSIPLWMGGSNWADMGQKQIALLKAGEALELQEETKGLNVRSSFFDLISALAAWELETGREKIARETLELVEDKYRQGALPIIDLLDAQSEYVSAQAAAVSSYYSVYSELVRLEREVGLIGAAAAPEEVAAFSAALLASLAQTAP